VNSVAQAADTSTTLTTQLARCQAHVAAQRLLTDTQGRETAYDCYRDVLQQDSENAAAKAGLQTIAEHYQHWTRQALAQQQWTKAALYLERLAKVAPDSPALHSLHQQYRQQQVDNLLTSCQAHQAAKRLMTGVGETAYSCYRHVLKLDTDNAKAKAGLAAIAEQYYTWATAKLSQDPAQAKSYVERLAVVAPNHPELARLQTQLGLTVQAQSTPTVVEQAAPVAETALADNNTPTDASAMPTVVMPTPATPPKLRKLEQPWLEDLTGLQFVHIPKGCFDFGSPKTEQGRFSDEALVPELCVKSFWLSDSEVSNAQYRLFRAEHYSQHYLGQSLDQAQQPVVYVSLADAQAFADWLTRYYKGQFHFRLPTEAEWEYAARAGSAQAHYWGDDKLYHACQFANTHDLNSLQNNPFDEFSDWQKNGAFPCDDGFAVTAPVKQFYPNAFGLYDMLGNVWEWTCSAYDPSQHRGETAQRCNDLLPADKRVIKGGAWNFRSRFIRAAARYPEPISKQTHYLGFRLVRE